MIPKRTQRDRVLEYLKAHGTLSVPKRIEELRKMGYSISTNWKVTDTGSRYGVYTLQEVNA